MVATARIAAVAQIDPQNSLDSANVTPIWNTLPWAHTRLPHSPHLDRFIRFCKDHGWSHRDADWDVDSSGPNKPCTGWAKKLYIFQHAICVEPFKIKRCWFYYNVRKISVMKCNYNFLANFLQILCESLVLKDANNYCIIGDVICINMHHLTADDKVLILALRVKKRWNVDKMILEFPNKHWKRQTLYYLVQKIDQTESAARLSGSGRPRTISQDLIDDAISFRK